MITTFDHFLLELKIDGYYKGKPFNKSFAYHLNKKRELWKKIYGVNWNEHVSKGEMKQVILDILKLPHNVLYMSKLERQWWRYKIEFEDSNHFQTLKIFYDAELSLIGLSINRQKRNYR